MDYSRITYIRESLEMSQRELANILGVPKSNYARWETGECIIPLKSLIDLCNLSNFSLDFALGISNDKTKNYHKKHLNYEKLGHNIKKIRQERGLTLKKFAEPLNTSYNVIHRCETAKAKNLTNLLYDIAKVYNIKIDTLI